MLASHRDWWLSLDGWWALWAAASAHDSSPGHAPSGFDRWLRRINPMFSRCSSKMQTAWSLNTFGKEGWKKHHKTKGFETSQITPASLYGVSWSCKEEKNSKTCLRKMQKASALQSLISGSPKSGDVEFLQILSSPYSSRVCWQVSKIGFVCAKIQRQEQQLVYMTGPIIAGDISSLTCSLANLFTILLNWWLDYLQINAEKRRTRSRRAHQDWMCLEFFRWVLNTPATQ